MSAHLYFPVTVKRSHELMPRVLQGATGCCRVLQDAAGSPQWQEAGMMEDGPQRPLDPLTIDVGD